MYPPIYTLLSADSQVSPWVGTRIYPHGKAPQRVTAPYVTWDVMGGAPDNTLGEAPLSDSYVVRVRLWSEHGDAVDVFAIGAAIRGIVGKVAKVVLSIAVVFNVAGLNRQLLTPSTAD